MTKEERSNCKGHQNILHLPQICPDIELKKFPVPENQFMCTQTKTKPIFVQELSRQNLKSIMCQADYVQSLGQLDERL